MSILIDTNVISVVFDKGNDLHEEFEPVFNWIMNGRGKMVYGGTKYLNELGKLKKYLPLIKILKDNSKVVTLKKETVDKVQEEVESRESDKDFDDPHLIAIIIVSKLKLLCTKDSRCHKFIKKSELYGREGNPPKIYTCKNNTDLINETNIVDCCIPKIKLNKEKRTFIEKIIQKICTK